MREGRSKQGRYVLEPEAAPGSAVEPPQKVEKRGGVFGLGVAGEPTSGQKRRAFRVWLLVGTIVVLSMADLYMTLAHLQSVGMGEANPLARMVMSYHSPGLLAAWKCACVAVGCLIFILARFKASAEVACWVSCAILTGLTIHWIRYSNEASSMTAQINELTAAGPEANWVSMEK